MRPPSGLCSVPAQRLPSDFHTLAAEYARYRSSYSDALFDAVVEYAAPTRALRALDLACGTGLSTRGIAARGLAVTGVDIAPNMLAAARESLPQCAFHEGRAETLPFADGAFGVVTCAQAFHWFDGPRAYAEIARVLAPGGTLAAFWKNALDEDPVNKLTDELEREMSSGKADEVSKAVLADLREEWNAAPFDDKRRLVFDVRLPFTVDSYIGYQSSRETLRLSLGERRFDYLDALRERLSALAPDGTFEVAAREYLFVGRRRGRA